LPRYHFKRSENVILLEKIYFLALILNSCDDNQYQNHASNNYLCLMNNTAKFLIVFFIILIVGFLTYFKYQQDHHLHNLQVLGEGGHVVGAFSFTDQDGKTITEKDVDGKIRIV